MTFRDLGSQLSLSTLILIGTILVHVALFITGKDVAMTSLAERMDENKRVVADHEQRIRTIERELLATMSRIETRIAAADTRLAHIERMMGSSTGGR